MTRHRHPRPGFTLVELLVSIALGLTLLGLAILVSQSRAFDSYKVVGSADRLSQWMLIAKNRAGRDKAPRGIRLLPDASNPNLVKEIAYIEQPEPWIPPPPPAGGQPIQLIFQYGLKESPSGTGINQRAFLNLNGVVSPADFQAAVRPNDTLIVPQFGQAYVVRQIISPVSTSSKIVTENPNPTLPTPAADATWVELDLFTYPAMGAAYSKVPPQNMPDVIPQQANPTLATNNFGFYRQPRPLVGLPTELLPSGMAVDLAASLNPPTAATPTAPLDILFSPSGEVIGATEGLSALLVRDSNLPGVTTPLSDSAAYGQAGQMLLICVYNRTGAIGTQPVNPPTNPPMTPRTIDPYQFAKDGINTGL